MSSVPSATLSPAPSSPTSASPGTRQSSNVTVPIGWGATSSMRSDTRSPGVSASTASATKLRGPHSGKRQKTR